MRQSFALFRDEAIHGDDRCLCRENLLGENPVNLRIRVETGVLEDAAAVIQVEHASQRGEHDAARRHSEEHQILNATRAKNQVKQVLRKRAKPRMNCEKNSGFAPLVSTANGRVSHSLNMWSYTRI